MLIGKVSGKITTKSFNFDAEARISKRQFISLKDTEGHWILAFVDNIVRYADSVSIKAKVIGYRDTRHFLKTPTTPFASGTPVYAAEKDFIQDTLGLDEKGLYIGLLEGYNIKVKLPIDHLIKKHIAVLAKTGLGKSYAVGVLLEELIENNIPVVVIDPHGEYHTLMKENTKKSEIKFAERFEIKPKSYRDRINLFNTKSGNQIKLNSQLDPEELFHMLPTKISSSQKGVLYSAIRNLSDEYTLRDIIEEVGQSNSSAKWNLLSMLEGLEATKLFSANPTKPTDLVQKNKVSIIDLKNAKPEIQQIIAMKVIEDLFNARKRGKIPQFLLVVEEAHNFCPERGFGEVASSKILRTVASEGRKFGMGLAIISQRPARVDKNVLSQANTQIILKVTNPNDLKAITDSVEGVMPGTKDDIKELPVGVAMIVGVTDQPIIVDIRVRRTEHGGEELKLDETFLPEEKTLLFKPQINQKHIEAEYKGIGEIKLLHYPLWKIAYEDDPVSNLYVDGLTGEILFERGDTFIRSKGLKEILDLPPSSRAVMLYLISHQFASIDKLSAELKQPLTTTQTNMKTLLADGYIATDGYVFSNNADILLPEEIPVLPIDQHQEEGELNGFIIDFMVSEESAKKAADIWNLKVKKIEPIYYPYWLIKHKNKKFLIDGIKSKIVTELADLVFKFV